jgi:16S rRNA (cytidine1402-2'-O)-methyltransferase
MGTHYIVATPIGNLDDISKRARQTLNGVDLILAEDTRVTQKLLQHYDIATPLFSYHQHSRLQKTDQVLVWLRQGKNLALVSDAGTPGISDPGNALIERVVESFGGQAKIFSVPGPSALAAAASLAGFNMDKFLFLGFPPAKKKRKRFFQEVLNSKYPAIFYESKYKILKTLSELIQARQNSTIDRSTVLFPKVVVCQELTKKFEKIFRGNLKEVLEKIKSSDQRGEFVVIVRNLS